MISYDILTYRYDRLIITQHHNNVQEQFLQLKIFMICEQFQMLYQNIVAFHWSNSYGSNSVKSITIIKVDMQKALRLLSGPNEGIRLYNDFCTKL